MADDDTPPKAAFRAMSEATRKDWTIIQAAGQGFNRGHADRLLAALRSLAEDDGGFQVTRLEHCLQTATRAFRDGRDEEYVVCALMHDVGDTLGWANHAEVGAAIMRPSFRWRRRKRCRCGGYPGPLGASGRGCPTTRRSARRLPLC